MKLYVKICLLWAVFFGFMSKAGAQYLKEHNYYDLTYSSNGAQSLVAVNWSHLHGIGKNKKFSIGYGVRFNSSFGRNTDFITAPAQLTSGKTGVGVIFTETMVENLDTISMDKYLVNSLNLAIHLNYQLNPKLMIEFNIDALGFSFGPEQMATYNSSKRLSSPNQEVEQKALTTKYNVLLISDNDIGSLNSEILLKYWFSSKWAMKAGASFSFTEYTTENELYSNNDRFRNKSLQGMIGISYSPFRK